MQFHRHRGGLGRGLIDGLCLLIQSAGLPTAFLLAGAKHMVAPLTHQIAVGKAVPGEHLLQLLQFILGWLPLLHQRSFVDAGDQCGIFRPLHAAFDFQGMDAGLLQVLQVLRHAGILQAEGITRASAGEAVLHPAGLGAQTPVARPSADGGR